jgi:nucleoside-diphosphate-sugar epimerase
MTTNSDIIRQDCDHIAHGSTHLLNPLKNSCMLITGGTGFMGTWLAEMVSYLNDAHDFHIRLMLLSSRASNFTARVPQIALRSDVKLIERDIRNLRDLAEDVNWVIHAAANPDSRHHASDPQRTVEVIVNGTSSVLEYATRLPDLRMFLNVSSGNVYGAQPWDLSGLSEDSFGGLDCSSLNATYAEAKRIGETLCTIYRNQHRLPLVNARPFAFIGPYQLLDRPWAINNFIRDSLRGGPIRILGDGETVRSYMYPADMAWWILNILVRGRTGSSYNIGSPQGVTLNQLAEKIATKFPHPPKILSGLSSDERMKRTKFVPDISLAQKSLGLKLKVDLDTAIQRTIQWNKLLTVGVQSGHE